MSLMRSVVYAYELYKEFVSKLDTGSSITARTFLPAIWALERDFRKCRYAMADFSPSLRCVIVAPFRLIEYPSPSI